MEFHRQPDTFATGPSAAALKTASGFVRAREIAKTSITFGGTRLGPWKQDGKDKNQGMWHKWEDRVDGMFCERMEKKKHTVRTGRCRERTVITGRATDTVLKGMQGNFTVIVQKYLLLLTRRVMIDDSFFKNETFSSEWFWRVWKERTAVHVRRSCLDGSDYKFSCFCSRQLQNLLNKNLSDTERCKRG